MNGYSQITLIDAELEDMSVICSCYYCEYILIGVLVYEHMEYYKMISITFT